MDAAALSKLKAWFISERRDFPWRTNPSPYAIWVSEVMLQQTQAAVVVPYFERWMKRFPSISALAKAPIEEVLKEWEGLGYYSRARNLHAGANYVLNFFGGELPQTAEQLKKIKGVGAYTIGAILSFAFHQRMAAVDGNVLRVLSRYYGLTDDISKTKNVEKIRTITLNLLPERESWVISEALIELGAVVCGRLAKCLQCPLKTDCVANQMGTTDQLPVKSSKSKTQLLYRAVAVLACENHLLVTQGIKGKVMADLCEFPYFSIDQAKINEEEICKRLSENFNLNADWQQALSPVTHSFTRFRAHLFPHLLTISLMKKIPGYQWLPIQELKKLAFSSGHRRIFTEVQQLID